MSLTPFVTAELLAGAICLTVAAMHLGVCFHRVGWRLHLVFAATALAVAGDAFSSLFVHTALNPEALLTAHKWQVGFQCTVALGLVWFLALYGGLRRTWLLGTYTAVYAVAIVIHAASPFGIMFRQSPTLQDVQLPWGERVSVPAGEPGQWVLFGDLLSIGISALAVAACVQFWRAGDRRKAGGLAVAVAPLLLVALPHGLLVDKGILQSPYLFTFGFLGLVIAMSMELVGQVALASRLARSVEENELRWSSFLDNLRLLVVGIDADGHINYVNPFVEQLTGQRAEKLIGRHLKKLDPDNGNPDSFEMFTKVAAGKADLSPRVRRAVPGKDGERLVEWSTATIRGVDGTVRQVVSIGADITEQAEAERARDRAMQQIKELKAQLEEENIYLKQEISGDEEFSEIVGKSNSVKYVLHMVQNVAATDASVLIQGETGVGKELVARAVHRLSSRSSKPFMRVNCGALPATLVEAELFGHEKGAFTGADRLRRGRFELADKGTLFLDEIGELPPEIQTRLLRVLQEGEFERLGSSETRRVDVRLIAATNRNLEAEVEAERFRMDLFYRINVYPITVPPLRDRADDIPLLVQHFVSHVSAKHRKRFEEIPAQTMRDLCVYDWPGNVRELINVIERAVITSPEPILRLPGPVKSDTKLAAQEQPAETRHVPLEEMQRRYILDVLKSTAWKIGGPEGASRVLGLNESTLRSRMKKLGIKRSESAPDRSDRPPAQPGSEILA